MKKTMLDKLELNKRIARNLKCYRIKAGLTDCELSKLIGKPKDYVSKIEHLKLKEPPDFWVIVCIAKELNLTLGQLIEEDNFANK